MPVTMLQDWVHSGSAMEKLFQANCTEKKINTMHSACAPNWAWLTLPGATWVIGNIGPKPVGKYGVWEVGWKATGVDKECGEEGTSMHQKLYSSLVKISLSTLNYSNFFTINIGNKSWLLEKVFSVREYEL